MRLAGKIALVTGGTTGIGYATAKLFRDEGAKVIITGLSLDRLAEAKRTLGEDVLAIRADAGNVADTLVMAREVEQAFGALDVLFLNAGVAKRADLAQITEEKFDEMFGVNVKGVIFPVQKLAPILRPGGSIIVTTSVNIHIGMKSTHLYTASKAAARALVRTLAGELAPRKIRVNAVSPGPIVTALGPKMDMSEAELNELAEDAIRKVPLSRFGSADELAQAVLFLASDASSFVTGTEVAVDGGWGGVQP